MKSGTPAHLSRSIAEENGTVASTTGKSQATAIVAGKNAPSSMPDRAGGGAGTDVEGEEEDSEKQQPVPPQAQQVQGEFESPVIEVGAARLTCAQTSKRLNRMTNGFFTGAS